MGKLSASLTSAVRSARRDVAVEQPRADLGADFGGVGPARAAICEGRQRVEPLGQVQAAVRRRAGEERVDERRGRGRAPAC